MIRPGTPARLGVLGRPYDAPPYRPRTVGETHWAARLCVTVAVLLASSLVVAITSAAASAVGIPDVFRYHPVDVQQIWRPAMSSATEGGALPAADGLPLVADRDAVVDAGELDGGSEHVLGGQVFQWREPMRFHAKIFRSKRFNCGGTLITRRHILTAAHCRVNVNATVRLGGLKLTDGLEVPVGRRIAHPDYQPALSRSDVAIIELGRELTLKEMKANGLEPVRLNRWPKAPTPGSQAALTGWGYRVQGPSGTVVNLVIKAQLTVIDVEECNARYQQMFLVSIDKSQELCAGRNGRRSCNGVRVGRRVWERGRVAARFACYRAAEVALARVWAAPTRPYDWIRHRIRCTWSRCCHAGTRRDAAY